MHKIFHFFAITVAASFFATNAAAQQPVSTADNCWRQHRATVHEWVCASQHLPAQGADYALSIVVVESPKALLVIDSGATAAVGDAAAHAIQARFGNRPVWVLNTQPKPEHVLGNVGFRAVFGNTLREGETFSSRIVAGRQTADLMRARCPTCIENFSERMGSDSVKGTESLVPARILKGESGNLGALSADWSAWKYRFYKNLETEEAIVLRNQPLKLWWVGSALQNREVPDLYDGQVMNRIDFLARLKTRMSEDDLLLTSFGVLDAAWIDRNLEYFVEVQSQVLYGLEAGESEVELIEQISGNVADFDRKSNPKALETHQLNIQRIYRQTEPLAF